MSLQFQQFPVRKLSKGLVKCGGDESAVLKIVEEFHRKSDICWRFFLTSSTFTHLFRSLPHLNSMLQCLSNPFTSSFIPLFCESLAGFCDFLPMTGLVQKLITCCVTTGNSQYRFVFFYCQTCCNFTVSCLKR